MTIAVKSFATLIFTKSLVPHQLIKTAVSCDKYFCPHTVCQIDLGWKPIKCPIKGTLANSVNQDQMQ